MKDTVEKSSGEIYPALMREFDEGLLEGFAFSDDLVHELHWFFRRTIEAYAERGLPFIKRRRIMSDEKQAAENKCKICGFPIADGADICGECACEDDCRPD